MTVYSYISESILLTIADVANEEIGTYADLIVSTFSATRSKFVNAKGQLEESIAYDYNESSVVGPEGEDYGLISNSAIIFEDYGSITESDYYPWQQEDYGLIINDNTLRPFGRLYAVNNTPAESLSRTSEINGVRFLLYGNSSVSVLPLIFGSGYLVAYGESSQKQTASYVGSGSLLGLSGGVEKVTVSYNQSSVVNPIGDDYGLITSAIVGQDDYGTVLEDTYYPWQQEDYGLITDNESIFPYGNINVEGNVEEKLSSTVISSGKVDIIGRAQVFVTPKHVGSGIIVISGGITFRTTPKWEVSGIIFGFGGSAEVSGSNPQESTQLFKISGSATETVTNPYIGSGSLFTFISSSEVSSSNPPESTELFKITGSSVERTRDSYVGSGSLFNIINKVEKRTYVYNESAYVGTFGDDYGFISQSPISEDDYGFLSGNPYYPWQQEDYGFLEPDGSLIPYGKIKIGGSAFDAFDKIYPHSGFGFVTISGSAGIFAAITNIGDVLFDFNGSAIEKNTETHIGSGLVTLSNVIDKNINPDIRFFTQVETVTWNPPESTELFNIDGLAIEKNTESYVGSGRIFIGERIRPIFRLKHIGSGSISLSGNGQESYIRTPFIGFGSIFTFISSTEVSGSNPPESTELFKITGSAVERTRDFYVGSGSVNLDSASTTIFRLKHIGSGLIDISDSAKESTTPAPHVGSGSIFTFIGSSESTTSNPPESTELFKITGSAVERTRDFYAGSGSIFTFISSTEVSGSNPPESTELFRIAGRVAESITPAPHVGSGSIFTFISSTEVSGSNPPESTELFKITGSADESGSNFHVGSGSIFTFISSTEVSGSNPPESTELFKITGRSFESTTPAPHVGSGSIFTFISSSEVSSSNPPESTELFKITGTAEESILNPYVGSEYVDISGEATTIFSLGHIGSGSVFTFISSAEVSGSNPPESTELFKVSGSAEESGVNSYVGSGSLFKYSTTTESTTKFTSSTTLFRIFGDADDRSAESYVGSGTIFTFISSTEVIAKSDSTIGLFKVSGESQNSAVVKEDGSGSIEINGSVQESVSPTSHIGSGSIFTFISKTESKASFIRATGTIKLNGLSESKFNRSEFGRGGFEINGSATTIFKLKTIASGLFDIVGTAAESFTPTVHVGTGSITLFVTKSESVTFIPVSKGTVFTFVGNSTEKNTDAYDGNGSIKSLSGSAEVFTALYNVTKVLFNISGSALEAYVQGSFREEGNLTIRGKSSDKYVEYIPPTPTRIYII